MLSPNPLCKLLDIRYPIIQAGMAGQTTPELVAAVSNAGGLGILRIVFFPNVMSRVCLYNMHLPS